MVIGGGLSSLSSMTEIIVYHHLLTHHVLTADRKDSEDQKFSNFFLLHESNATVMKHQ